MNEGKQYIPLNQLALLLNIHYGRVHLFCKRNGIKTPKMKSNRMRKRRFISKEDTMRVVRGFAYLKNVNPDEYLEKLESIYGWKN